MSHSYSTQRDKNLSKLTGLAGNNRRLDDRNPESAALANQVLLQFHRCYMLFCWDEVVELKSSCVDLFFLLLHSIPV